MNGHYSVRSYWDEDYSFRLYQIVLVNNQGECKNTNVGLYRTFEEAFQVAEKLNKLVNESKL